MQPDAMPTLRSDSDVLTEADESQKKTWQSPLIESLDVEKTMMMGGAGGDTSASAS